MTVWNFLGIIVFLGILGYPFANMIYKTITLMPKTKLGVLCTVLVTLSFALIFLIPLKHMIYQTRDEERNKDWEMFYGIFMLTFVVVIITALFNM